MPVITATSPTQEADMGWTRPSSDHAHRTPPPGQHSKDRFSYSPVLSHRPTAPSPVLCHTSSSPSPFSLPDCYDAPAERSRTSSDPQANTEPPQTQSQISSTTVLRRKVFSKETAMTNPEKALQGQASRGNKEGEGSPFRSTKSVIQVPWEKDVSKEGLLGVCLGQGRASGAAVVQDPGLLEEIESMCCLSSVLHTSLQLSQVHCNNSHHQVQGKATDES